MFWVDSQMEPNEASRCSEIFENGFNTEVQLVSLLVLFSNNLYLNKKTIKIDKNRQSKHL